MASTILGVFGRKRKRTRGSAVSSAKLSSDNSSNDTVSVCSSFNDPEVFFAAPSKRPKLGLEEEVPEPACQLIDDDISFR
jgi:hypothetical protein